MRRDIAPLLRDHLLTAAALLTRLPLPGHGFAGAAVTGGLRSCVTAASAVSARWPWGW